MTGTIAKRRSGGPSTAGAGGDDTLLRDLQRLAALRAYGAFPPARIGHRGADRGAAHRQRAESQPGVQGGPYLLDFLGLKDRYLEKALEDAILRELESFVLELGTGFCFVARQMRSPIDDEDFHIDLVFHNRKLRRLLAIELKLCASCCSLPILPLHPAAKLASRRKTSPDTGRRCSASTGSIATGRTGPVGDLAMALPSRSGDAR